ncbi:metal ABC transporter permease [Tepidibacter thalassicus]|uniref:Zinc transport system permease protein n=1 Tax=Tepidibacter thalassicus DSM 15285 TaxID=1123350 RepID=A0A1M5NPY8_9FIRM|nr:metal ABC transporter permease [Tepidibacter thalassicus]SHG91580.1 zinc transport system permease protein [Tepidibacter thalassicus DSM 15285]
MLEMLQYGFIQRALMAGVIVGVLCPLIGVFIVLRRMSLIGDSLSHVALTGVVSGILLNVYPIVSALITSVIAAFAIEKLRKNYSEYAELSIAIILSAGIGIAVVLMSFVQSLNVDLFGYLFGSITTVLKEDLYMIGIIGFFIILFVKLLYKELFYIAFDEEGAKLSGIPVKWINLIFTIMVAATVTLSMRIVGALLVSSLMVIPVATSLQISNSFKQTTILSVIFAQVSIILGIIISYYLEIASGGTIVVLSIFILICVITIKNMRKIFLDIY